MDVQVIIALTKLGAIGVAFMALYVLALFVKKKYSGDYKKVSNELTHLVHSNEKRIESIESNIAEMKGDIGYLKGRINGKN